MMMGIVYKANNEFTGEAYIGITTNSIKQRQLDHIERALRGEAGKFYEALVTYGPEAFTWEQIDTAVNSNELAEKEKGYILKFKTKENGYNTDSGGGIKKYVFQYDKEKGKLINQYPNLKEAAHFIDSTKQDISRACLSANGLFEGFYWSYTKSDIFTSKGDIRKKRVIQLDLEGNLIAEFNSVAHASEKNGLSKTCISRVCRGERDYSGGFKWRYVGDDKTKLLTIKI